MGTYCNPGPQLIISGSQSGSWWVLFATGGVGAVRETSAHGRSLDNASGPPREEGGGCDLYRLLQVKNWRRQ